MWYFAWVLGLAFAALFGVVNALWLEHQEDRRELEGRDEEAPTGRA